MGEKVLVAMSGGVDSSVAAALLLEKGYEPIGITMRIWNEQEERKRKGCCSLDDVDDARRVADKLGIPHYTFNMKEAFKIHVVDYFVSEYLKGRTPNPCIACNRVLKFELLVNRAKQMGIAKFATGHYARIQKQGGRYVIRRGVDRKKDQSYFLFDIPVENLPNVILPIGELTKEQTRQTARRFGLKTAEKAESQEICFVPDDDYKAFITEYGVDVEEGNFVTSHGKKMGRHSGIPFYTVGQRRGLDISHHHRLYVTAIKPDTNTIVVGAENELLCDSMIVSNLTFHLPLSNGDEPFVQIRYRHKAVRCRLELLDNGVVSVAFKEPVRAIAPGQAAVFYMGDTVAGGGWIESFTPSSSSVEG